jgi:hypothetical protein
LILLSVVYRDVTQQANGLYRLKYGGALKRGLAYLSRCTSGWFYHNNFGRNRPTTALELRDMMARWADQEDEKNNRFPKRNHDKQGNGNGHFDKSQWNHSGNTRKRKLDHEVAAIEHNPRGKKSGNNHSEYEQVIRKQCPIHPKSWHTLFECITIRKSLNAPPLHQEGKRKDKEDKEGGTSLTSSSMETADSHPSARRS